MLPRERYVCQSHALFMYLIPEDVLLGDSKVIGIICALLNLSYPELYLPEKTTTTSRAGPTTAFGRVVGRQAYTKICAEQLCNMCCEYHYILYTHLRDNYVVYHHRTKMAEAATSHTCRAISHQPLIG